MSSQQKNILVIEDEEFIVQLLIKSVENDGHRAFSAGDYETAIEVLLTGDVDLVITDLNIPGIKDNSICRFVKTNQKLRHVPVILITGASGAILREEEKLADASVQKPFDLKTLTETINRLLDGRRESA